MYNYRSGGVRHSVAVVATLCLAPAVAAQDVPSISNDIVVTAQRRSERLQDVPVAVTAQSAAQLQSAGITNARDLTLVTPGLRIDASGIAAQPALRGVSSTLGSSNAENNVATYVDGIYQPTIIGAF